MGSSGSGGGGGANLWMAGSSIGQIGTTLAGSYANSQAIEASGAFQKQQFEFNKQLADLQAGDALTRGYKAAGQYQKKARGVIGSQRTSLAAQGVDVGVGSAADVQRDTLKLSEIDAMTIKNNAWQEAWGFKMQALDLSGKAQFAGISSRFEANNTLLAGGMKSLAYAGEAGYYASKYASSSPAPTYNIPTYNRTPGRES